MSQQVTNALDGVDEAMKKLNRAYDDISIRRDFLGLTYRALTRHMATLTVEVADNAGAFERR